MKKIINKIAWVITTFLTLHAQAQNVGIGTTTPIQKLEVAGNTYVRDSVGIGVANPQYKLDVGGRMRIKSKGDGNALESAGVWFNDNNNELAAFLGMRDDNTVGLFGTGLGNWGMGMNIYNGNVGIGVVNPQYKFDVGGRMRIKSKGDGNALESAGIWFNNSNNSAVPAFLGMRDDNTVGLFGTGFGNWGMGMNTNNGNVGIGLVNPQFKLDVGGRIRIQSGGTNTTSAGIWFNNSNNSTVTAFLGMRDDNTVGLFGTGFGDWGMGMNTNNGNVGIGVVNPQYKLDLGGRIRIQSGGSLNSTAGIWFNNNVNTQTNAFVGMRDDNIVGFYSAGYDNFSLQQSVTNGCVSIGNGNPDAGYFLRVYGNSIADNWFTTSDARYKQNILPIASALSTLMQLKGKTYHFNRAAYPNMNFDSTAQMGFIAQEIETVLPQLVSTDSKGYKSVNYTQVIPLLTEAVKEQQQKMDDLQKQIDELKNIIFKK